MRPTVRAALAASVALVAPVQGAVHQFSAILQQAQEVPSPIPVPGAGGLAAVSLDDTTNLLSWDVRWFNLSGSAVGAHFHAPAGPGATAGPVVNIGSISGLSSPSAGSTTITPTQANWLMNGEWYANVHTSLNPSGEIRGQLGVAGSSQNTPIFPSQGQPVRGQWVFNGVTGTGAWFDPFPATGYLYQTDGLSSFTGVILPNALPDNNGTYIVSDPGGPVVVPAGGSHTFSSPVTSFTITDILPTVDGDNPFAFPTWLQFNQQTVSFTMTPLPEPACVAFAAIGAMFLARRRRRA